jgi:hypothetical protein
MTCHHSCLLLEVQQLSPCNACNSPPAPLLESSRQRFCSDTFELLGSSSLYTAMPGKARLARRQAVWLDWSGRFVGQ